MPPEILLGAVVAAALLIYALSGGADFGGGVWDLLASGSRAGAQRDLIAQAIGPIWEANHVWLVLVVVVLFVCFPVAFAALSVALHVPLTLMLIGIVLRGSAFAFRSHGEETSHGERRWSLLFAITSAVTPLMLGVCLGAVAAGRVRVDAEGRAAPEFLRSWLAPYPFAVGFLVLSLFAMLAAIYLIHETADQDLKEDFRGRGLLAGLAAAALAGLGLVLAPHGAPRIEAGLLASAWAPTFLGVTGVVAAGTLVALWRRRYGWARILAIAEVTLVVAGWAASQFPYAIPPDLTLAEAAAPSPVLSLTLVALGAGSLILLPAFLYLYWIFKRRREG